MVVKLEIRNHSVLLDDLQFSCPANPSLEQELNEFKKPFEERQWIHLPWISHSETDEEIENEMAEYMEARLQEQFGPLKVIQYNEVPDEEFFQELARHGILT